MDRVLPGAWRDSLTQNSITCAFHNLILASLSSKRRS